MSSVIKETRQVSEFDRIAVKGVGKIFITQGAQQEVTVEADDGLMKRITTEVVDGKLTIDIGRDWVERMSAGLEFLSSREIIFRITAKKLSALEISGACEMEVSTLKTDQLDLKMSGASNVRVVDLSAAKLNASLPGAGKVVVSGKSDDHEISLTGAGNYDAGKLKCKNVKVNMTGVGNATVWATDNLEVAVTGVGNIEYYGSPHIKQNTTMLGSVRNLGAEPK